MEVKHQMLDKEAMQRGYETVQQFHEKFLKKVGVTLPKLFSSPGIYTKDALVLVYLAVGYPRTRPVSKIELTSFVRSFFPDTNDTQQARQPWSAEGLVDCSRWT